MTRPLPSPATQQDEYGYAIVMELRQMNQTLAQLLTLLDGTTLVEDVEPNGESAEVEIKEPKPAHRDAKKAKAKDADPA